MAQNRMRGYFGVGVEGISKPMNVSAIMRTAHAFGASFVFTIRAVYSRHEGRRSDTSDAPEHLPLHEYDGLDDFTLPRGCDLIGVELTDDAVDLPSFRHPHQAAYVLGPERVRCHWSWWIGARMSSGFRHISASMSAWQRRS